MLTNDVVSFEQLGPGAVINPQWLELPIYRINFDGPKDVWTIDCIPIKPRSEDSKVANYLIRSVWKILRVIRVSKFFLLEHIRPLQSMSKRWWGSLFLLSK